jgi:hypothetical protein
MLNAEKGVRRRVRKSRQKEAARATDAGLMEFGMSYFQALTQMLD